MLQAACSTKIHAYKVPGLQKQGDAEKTAVATRVTTWTATAVTTMHIEGTRGRLLCREIKTLTATKMR